MTTKSICDDKVILLLEGITTRLDKIEERLSKVEEGTSNMNQHIGFVEKIIYNLPQPLSFLFGVEYKPPCKLQLLEDNPKKIKSV